MGLLVARAKLTFGDSRVITKDSSVLNVDTFKDSGMKIEFRAGYSGYQHTMLFSGLQSLDEVIIEDPNNTNSAVLVFNDTTKFNEIVLTSTGNAGVLTFKTKSKVLKRVSFTNKTPAGGAETVTALKGILAFSDVITEVTITNSATNFTVPASIPSNLKRLSFTGSTYFNDPNVLTWDTSNITTMVGMFTYASAFNQPIGNWYVSNVTNMASMFAYASAFNQPIGNWNVSNVADMASMFAYASAFNQPIGNWNVSNVADMASMFAYASAFNQPIGNWNVSNVINMAGMFAYASAFNQPIGNWNVGRVADMARMFDYARAFNQPIGNWNVSNVINMAGMFTYASAFNQPIGNWYVGRVADMARMFRNASAFNQDLTTWCVAKITTTPIQFAESALNFPTNKHPVWGTCPIIA